MGNDGQYSLNDYLKAFNNFHIYINQLYSDPNNIDKVKEGYIVNLYNYYNLIMRINEYLEKRKNQTQNGNNAFDDEVNLVKLKTENLKDVVEKINRNYKFIIINKDLFKVICDQEKQPIHKITYKIITENKLSVQENELQIQIKNFKNNIISKETILVNIENKKIINSFNNPLYKSESKISHASFDKQSTDNSWQTYFLIDSGFHKVLTNYLSIDNNEYFNIYNQVNNIDYSSYILTTSRLKNSQFYYPINFDVLDEFIINKIIKILKNLDNTTKQNLFEEICLIHVNDGFVLRSNKNNSIFDKNNNLIYLYSDKVNSQPKLIQLIAIFECYNINDRNNKFDLIADMINDINIIKYPNVFANQIKSKCHLNIEQTNINKEETLIKTIPQFHMKSKELPFTNNKNELQNNPIDISNKLKVMILFEISQRYLLENELQKVYLINLDWLKKFEAKEIKSLVDNKWDQIARIWGYAYDLNSLSKIISIFDIKQLKILDSKLNIENKNFPLNNPEIVKLIDKYIHFYRKNFILANDKIFVLFQKYFGMTQTNDDLSYIHIKKGGDILIINNSQFYFPQGQINTRNLILIGIISFKKLIM